MKGIEHVNTSLLKANSLKLNIFYHFTNKRQPYSKIVLTNIKQIFYAFHSTIHLYISPTKEPLKGIWRWHTPMKPNHTTKYEFWCPVVVNFTFKLSPQYVNAVWNWRLINMAQPQSCSTVRQTGTETCCNQQSMTMSRDS